MDEFPLSILIVPFAAVLAPLLAMLVGRALLVPLVVFEIALGVLVGPAGFGWVEADPILTMLSQLGLAMLFFMAGIEIDPASLGGRTGRRSLGGWGISAVLALVAGFVIGGSPATGVIIAIALTGTALGTITPMLRDAGISKTPLGSTINSAGAVGEFLPLVAISVFLSGRQPLIGALVLIVFVGIAAFAFWAAASGPHQWLRRMVTATLHTSGQFAVRFVVVLLAALVSLAVALGVDFLLGAFTAGLLAKIVLRGCEPQEQEIIAVKLDSISFGFFVPVFFVTTGVTFPLTTLVSDAAALALVPLFAVAMLIVRGLPGFFGPGPGAMLSDRRTSALFTATTLPLVIAVTQIGLREQVLTESTAAAMLGGAMLTVLLFPMLALAGRKQPGRAAA